MPTPQQQELYMRSGLEVPEQMLPREGLSVLDVLVVVMLWSTVYVKAAEPAFHCLDLLKW